MSVGRPIRVGIVGANAARGWARDAHLPALGKLSGDFVLSAVSARTQVLAEAARDAYGAETAFGDSLGLARSPSVDLVCVVVKVPEHHAIVLAALAAGKHVYCEWPLGRDLAEAQEMAAAVDPVSHVMIGLQGLSSPAVLAAADLVRSGAIGRPLAMRVFSPTAGWGTQAPPHYAYLQDKWNGATLETIAGGHTLAVMEALVGAFVEVDARNSILHSHIDVVGQGAVERTCADHMMVLGRHAGGCVSTLEVAGGVTGKPFRLELDGDAGWIRITGDFVGGFQGGVLTLETSVADAPSVAAITDLTGPPANLAESYARLAADIRTGQRTVPDFERAVRLSRLLETIDLASTSGHRTTGALT